ncbi:MAG: aspartate/glutamate racemase family protein [Methylobacteriaceae bacterium]|nr:aspartate/glutamate racemase family protein [Methylobacteriaceae bacterium]
MHTIGLIGGMSWESTAIYYRLINELVRDRLGGVHSAKVLLDSVDFAEIEVLQRTDRWEEAGGRLAEAARRIEAAGADCILICANTMHKVAPAVTAAVRVPLIHIVDATAAQLRSRGSSRPLLLATRYIMEQDFYTGRLSRTFGIEAHVPGAEDRAILHAIIFNELVRGIVRAESKARCLDMIARGRQAGCDGVIFGCTEIGMLLSQDDLTEPAFDTAAIHAAAAVDFALAAEPVSSPHKVPA